MASPAGANTLHSLALAGVHAAANLDAQVARPLGERDRAAYRAGRSIERGEETVAGVLDLAAAKARDLGASDLVVAFEQLSPRAIAEEAMSPPSLVA